MKAKKVLALCVAAAMTMSLAACGNEEAGGNASQGTVEQSPESTAESTQEESPASSEAPGDAAPEAGPASIDFEDGLFGFVGDNTTVAGGLGNAGGYSIVDYNGSKALEVAPNGAKGVGVGFQIDALLGDKAAQVKTVEASVGVSSSDGKFYACSGKVYGLYAGEKDGDAWSVYLETANPKTVSYEVPEGRSFGEGDNLVISLETDNASSESGWQTLYIDNVTFKDADGNVIEADTSAEYAVAETGLDPNLMVLKDVVELEGFAGSGAGWSQSGPNPLTEEQAALIAENLVPGSVIEIEYSSDSPIWLVSDGQTGWQRAVDESSYEVCGAVADGKVQYTYEQLASFWGEGFEQNMTFLQGESAADFEIFSVKIGSGAVQRAHDLVEVEGFAGSGAGWSQSGPNPLTEEQVALIAEKLVPGSVLNIEYTADTPIWLVSDGQTGWQRAVDESTYEVCGAVYKDGGAVQYTYEQLASFWGEGFEKKMTFLQGESSSDYEIYSVKIGQTN